MSSIRYPRLKYSHRPAAPCVPPHAYPHLSFTLHHTEPFRLRTVQAPPSPPTPPPRPTPHALPSLSPGSAAGCGPAG